MNINAGNLDPAIEASLSNGDRIFEDARTLLEHERFPTAYALFILAQEEYAKAFLLHLVKIKAIPWTSEVWRTLTDHSCKQLLMFVMDYLNPEWEEFAARINIKAELLFPAHIVDAIHIIRHEKVSRLSQRAWINGNDPPCDRQSRKIAEGLVDKQKQDAMYIRLSKTGNVVNTPSVLEDEATQELEKAERLRNVLRKYNGSVDSPISLEFEMVAEMFRLLFGLKTVEDYNQNWWIK